VTNVMKLQTSRMLAAALAAMAAVIGAGCSPATTGSATPRSSLPPGQIAGTGSTLPTPPASDPTAGSATPGATARPVARAPATGSSSAASSRGLGPEPPTATASAALHVAGNRLVDAAGASVLLHGVDMSGTETTCAQNWTTDPFGGQPEDNLATFAAMQSWDINAVRVPLNEDCWLGINGVEIAGPPTRARS